MVVDSFNKDSRAKSAIFLRSDERAGKMYAAYFVTWGFDETPFWGVQGTGHKARGRADIERGVRVKAVAS